MSILKNELLEMINKLMLYEKSGQLSSYGGWLLSQARQNIEQAFFHWHKEV